MLLQKLIVTGGMGFIGSNFIRHAIEQNANVEIKNIDKLSYASIKPNTSNFPQSKLFQYDLSWEWTTENLVSMIDEFQPEHIIHFAAESHVDNSIRTPLYFLANNVAGTVHLLNAMERAKHKCPLLYISTDEVYGSVDHHVGPFREIDQFHPNSPYSASKAAAEMFVRAYGSTYDIPYTITRSTNNYGPYQHPEKFIPKCIINALQDKPIPVYGDGQNVREWIHVSDNVKALFKILTKKMTVEDYGEAFNIGSGTCWANIAVAEEILKILGKPTSLIQLVHDRPGHDAMYNVDTFKFQIHYNDWKPEIEFLAGLEATIKWYDENRSFWEASA